jgi:multidrug efflux system membrane fusion protein
MRLVDQGNIVHATDQTGLVVLTQIEPISVVFTLPEDALPDVARSMAKGPLKVLAFSRDNKPNSATGHSRSSTTRSIRPRGRSA